MQGASVASGEVWCVDDVDVEKAAREQSAREQAAREQAWVPVVMRFVHSMTASPIAWPSVVSKTSRESQKLPERLFKIFLSCSSYTSYSTFAPPPK